MGASMGAITAEHLLTHHLKRAMSCMLQRARPAPPELTRPPPPLPP
jgi:hypothetical protein